MRGIVTLALAAWAFMSPSTVATGLVYVFAAYFIITGIETLFIGVSFTGVSQWWAFILMGLVELALGIIMLSRPEIGPLALAYLFAISLLVIGIMELSAAISLRDYINNDFWWILLGIVTLAVGVYIVIRPDIGPLALVYTVGVYAVLAGISLIVVAFRIKNAGAEFAKHHAIA